MIRLAIFDLDGTLIDSKEDLAQAVNFALGQVGAPQRSQQEVSTFVGDGATKLVSRALPEQSQELIDPALDAWRDYYADHLLDHTALYPGIAEVLASARCPLAVQTNKPGDMARKILDGLGVANRFSMVVGGDEGPRKPDPSGTLEIMARMGATAEETVFIGDSLVDLQTARAAGIRFVAVTWGYIAESDLVAGGAPRVVRAAPELLPWVGAVEGAAQR